MKLSVVIVSYNVVHYLEQCIDSVYRALHGLESEIWVVDNASTDGTPNYIKEKFPQVSFISNEKNVGFSKANNQAIRQSTGDYILLLNPDTVIGEDVLSRCISFMDRHERSGALGVAMLRNNGSLAWESRRGLPTPFTAFCKMSGLCSLFPKSRRFGRYYMRYLNPHEANEIEVVSGAFMMLRRSALEKVGNLDEDFFMYGEDIDLSYRILQAGYINYYLPCNILHYKGESTQKSSFRYVNVFYRAMLTFFDKHYKKSYYWLSPLIRLAVVMRGFLDLLLQQRERIYTMLGLNKIRKSHPFICFIGSQSSIDEMKEIASRFSLQVEYHLVNNELLQKGHLSLLEASAKYNVVAYDNEIFTNAQILSFMRQSAEVNDLALALYSPLRKKLITLNNIYSNAL